MTSVLLYGAQEIKFPAGSVCAVEKSVIQQLISGCYASRDVLLQIHRLKSALPETGADSLLNPLTALQEKINEMFRDFSLNFDDPVVPPIQFTGSVWHAEVQSRDGDSYIALNQTGAYTILYRLNSSLNSISVFLHHSDFTQPLQKTEIENLDQEILSLLHLLLAFTGKVQRLLPIAHLRTFSTFNYTPERAEKLISALSFLEEK